MLASVEAYFRTIVDQDNQVFRNNLKFHVLMVLAWSINRSQTIPALRIPQLDLSKLTSDRVKAVTGWVFSEFGAEGAADRTAKDSAFTDRLKANWTLASTEPPPATAET